MSALVGVHGIGQHHLGRHQLAAVWKPALADGLERASGHRSAVPDLTLAFYGDLFLPAGDGRPTKGGDTAGDPLADLAEAELDDIVGSLTEAVPAADPSGPAPPVPKGYTRAPRGLQVLLRAIDLNFGAAAGVLSVGVLRQVRRYLVEPDRKAAVDARVAAAIDGSCRVLIGHSLGSVVAYEYLRTRPDHAVELFVTLGSPLGLRMVRDRLPTGEARIPTWVNVRDVRDPVACAGPLRSWWPQVASEVVVDNGGDSHAAQRYLSRAGTGRAVLSALPDLVGP